MSGCGLRGKLGYQTLACFSSLHSLWCVLPWYYCGTIQGNVQPSKGDTRFVGRKVNRSGFAALIRPLRRKSVGTFAFAVYLSYAQKWTLPSRRNFFLVPVYTQRVKLLTDRKKPSSSTPGGDMQPLGGLIWPPFQLKFYATRWSPVVFWGTGKWMIAKLCSSCMQCFA